MRGQAQRAGWRGEALIAAACAAAASLVITFHYRLWSNRPGVSWWYSTDGMHYEAITANVLDGQWYYRNPRLGVPYGSDLRAYPWSDHLNLALVKLIGTALGLPASTTANLFLFASFPLVAVGAYGALRWLEVRRGTAAVLSLLYAFTPYHLERNAGHLFLSMYALVPLAAAVLVRQLTGHAAFVHPDSQRLVRSRRSLLAGAAPIAIVALLPQTGAYHAIFFVLLALATAAALFAAGRHHRAAAVSTLLLAGVAGASFLLALSPVLWSSGTSEVVRRGYYESEMFGLRVDRMLLPAATHRVSALQGPFERIEATSPVKHIDATSPLGLAASVGFVVALVHLARRTLRRTPRAADREDTLEDDKVLGALGLLVVAAVLIGTVAGLGAVLNAIGFGQVRAWNRISIFIAFLALAALGLVLDRVLLRVRRRGLVGGVLALLLVVGLADQVTPFDQATRDGHVAAWQRDRAFFDEVEAQLDEGSSVLTLPPMTYPASPSVGQIGESDHLRAYLHTDSLRFSFGNVYPDTPAWAQDLAALPPAELVAGALVTGFDAIYLNRDGYEPDPGPVVEGLSGVLGPPTVTSADGQLVMWDIRALARGFDELPADDVRRARDDVLERVWALPADGFSPLDLNLGAFQWQLGPIGTLRIVNTLDTAAAVTLRVRSSAVAPGSITLELGPRRASSDVEPGRTTTVQLRAEVPPGETTVRLDTDVTPGIPGSDTRPLTLQLFDIDVKLVGAPSLATIARALGLPGA